MTRRRPLKLSRYLALLLAVFFSVSLSAQQDPESLWTAAREGDLAAIDAALKAGVAIDAAKRYGATALSMAAGAGHLEVTKRLLEKGADVNAAETFWGTTSLMRALQAGHVEVALLLLEKGAGFDNQALFMATSAQRPELLEKMLASRRLYAFEKADALAIAQAMGPPENVKALEAAEVRDGLPAIELEESLLAKYTGAYGRRGEEKASFQVVKVGKSLEIRGEGADTIRLVAVDTRHFRSSPDPSMGVFFLSRAGYVDGFTLVPRGLPPTHVRKMDDAGHEIALSKPTPGAAAKRAPAPRQPARPWPSFRGAAASGVSDGQGVVAEWDVESGHNVRWRQELPGLGLSSPVVAGGRIFLTTAISEGDQSIKTGAYGNPASVEDDSSHDWRVMALSASDGKVLWSRSVADAVPEARRHLKSSHANSTVVTDGTTVAAVFPTAGLVALDAATGEVRWQHDLGGLSSGTDDKIFQWGYASSPILWQGLLILQVDIHDGSYLAAWDLDSGKQRWKTPRQEIPTWSTPTVIEHGEHVELVTNGTTIRGYDPRDGRELWTLGPNSEITIATPIGGDGLVYLTAGYPPVHTIYAVRLGHRGDLTLEEGVRSSDAIAWSHHRGGGYMPTPLLYRGLFYLPHHNGRLVAYDAKSGDTVYRARFSQRGTLTGSPVASDGMLFFTTEEGLVYVVEAGGTYRELAVHDLGAGIMTTPAVSDGSLYIRTLEHLWALGESKASASASDEKEASK